MNIELYPQDNSQENLLSHFQKQKAIIEWQQLEKFFAQGILVEVAASLDLVQAALALCQDNKPQVQEWLQKGLLQKVSDEKAKAFVADNRKLWSVVAAPWILVQQKNTEDKAN